MLKYPSPDQLKNNENYEIVKWARCAPYENNDNGRRDTGISEKINSENERKCEERQTSV